MALNDITLVRRIHIDTSFGWVDLNGIAMDGSKCYGMPDISWVWNGAATRGDDRLLPGVAGTIPYPRRPTKTKRSVKIIVIGAMDHTGAPASDYGITLQQNWDYLLANLVVPPSTSPFTYTATWHRPDGSTKTAPFVVENTDNALQGGAQLNGVLDLSLPYGYFQ